MLYLYQVWQGVKMGSGNIRLDRLLEKQKVIENRIKKIQITESKGRRKLQDRQKVLLGIMFQKMIADKVCRAETFTKYASTLSERDRKIVEDYWAGLSED
jgi:MinD superfamily P-loop ATPase